MDPAAADPKVIMPAPVGGYPADDEDDDCMIIEAPVVVPTRRDRQQKLLDANEKVNQVHLDAAKAEKKLQECKRKRRKLTKDLADASKKEEDAEEEYNDWVRKETEAEEKLIQAQEELEHAASDERRNPRKRLPNKGRALSP